MPSKAEENLPATNEGYGTREYWEQRYTVEGVGHDFDWFLKPDYLLQFFDGLTKDIDVGKDARILILGCGNSSLGEALYDAGWRNLVNIDYSKAVIEQMIERHGETRPQMKWLEMDVLDLKFEQEFDLVVDKATMDAMLTTKGDPWNPPQKDIDMCTKEVHEGLRVLRKQLGSKFVYWSFGQPHFRKRFFINRAGWKYSQKSVGPEDGFEYFQYLLEWEEVVA